MNYETAIKAVLMAMEKDYSEWSGKALQNPRMMWHPGKMYTIEPGRVYDKIVMSDVDGNHRSVAGFIVKKKEGVKKFKYGDMLKPASWKAPATNFARGNIFEPPYNCVSWTGIL